MALAAPRMSDEEVYARLNSAHGAGTVDKWLTDLAAEQEDEGNAKLANEFRKQCERLIGFTEYRYARYVTAPHHALVASHLERVERREIDRLIIEMPPRHGKLLSDKCEIATPLGWRRHGDLAVGDEVFGPDGAPTKIVALSERSRATMRVTFSNGENIVCHPNHEWLIYDRARSVWRIMETREIAKRSLRNGPAGKRGGRWTLQVPLAMALNYPEAELPLDPYVLGAWLGDGKSNDALIAHAASDQEVVSAIIAVGFAPLRRYVQWQTGVHYARFGSDMRAALRLALVWNDKHIPESYLRASMEQRLELLAGLIDTDGHVEAATGRIRFSTTSGRLRDGVYDLATTLGFRPYVVSVDPALSTSGIQGRQVVYQVGFQPTMPIPTRIPRKAVKAFASQQRIGIVSVEPCPLVEPGRCIQVDRADGLYLVGRSLVPTHNSELASKSYPAWCIGRNPTKQIISASASNDLATDWGKAVRNIIASDEFKLVYPGVELAEDSRAAGKWMTKQGGIYVAASVGTSILGRGADEYLIDDPYGTMEDARSETIRDNVWEWFNGTVYNRLQPGGAIILIGHRIHETASAGQ